MGEQIRVGEHRETPICPCADQEHKRWRTSADELLTLEALACGVVPYKSGWRRRLEHIRAAGLRLALVSNGATLRRRLAPLSLWRERDLVAMDLTPSTSLAEIASQRPDLTRELERLGLDDCCGGERSLAVACAERGLDPEAITAELNGIPVAEAPAADWIALTPAELVDHLEATRHCTVKQELPRLSELAAKVSRVHGERHPELVRAATVLTEIRADLEPHLQKEEQVLFPMIRSLASSSHRASVHCGSIANPISVMEQEHPAVGALLERLRQLTSGHQAPADTCDPTLALMAGLAELEADPHLHVHKENNLLFPAVLAQEQRLAA